MKKIEFDLYDHFKGNFSKPKKVEKRYGTPNGLWPSDDMVETIITNLKKMLDTSDNGYFNDVDEWIINTESDELFEKEILGQFEAPVIECSHEPVDVGFNKIKMVCKTCNKEL